MRVLHVLNELNPSGVETMLRVAADYWRAAGIQGEILCTGETPGPYAPLLLEAGFLVHHVPFRRSARFLANAWEFLRDQHFDAVHIHTERACFWYAAAAALTGHQRIIRSIHGVFPFQGGLRVRRAVQRFLMRRALGVQMIACSESVQRNEWNTFRNTARVIPNWFDSTRFCPAGPGEREAARASFGIAPTQFVVCSVGNCSPLKNHGAILRGMGYNRGNPEVVYLHVGGEQPDGRERALAVEMGIADRVRFLGPLVDFRAVLHASDLFLMPSLREGFGIAAIEAMGAGVPVALADVEGLRDFRNLDAPAGFMAPTPAGVARAIQHFHQLGAQQRQADGLRLSLAAHRQFGAAAGAANYGSLYTDDTAAVIASGAVA